MPERVVRSLLELLRGQVLLVNLLRLLLLLLLVAAEQACLQPLLTFLLDFARGLFAQDFPPRKATTQKFPTFSTTSIPATSDEPPMRHDTHHDGISPVQLECNQQFTSLGKRQPPPHTSTLRGDTHRQTAQTDVTEPTHLRRGSSCARPAGAPRTRQSRRGALAASRRETPCSDSTLAGCSLLLLLLLLPRSLKMPQLCARACVRACVRV